MKGTKNMETIRHLEKYMLSALVLIICFGMSSKSSAQVVLGAKETAMGQSFTAMPGSPWSVFGNPAMMPQNTRAVSFYGIRYYQMNELTDMAAVGVYDLNFGVVGLGVHSYGFDLYRESRFRTAFAYEYEGITAAAAINYTQISIQNYGNAGTVVFDLGIAYNIIDDLYFGARATNISQSKIGQAAEELPRELSIGLSYQLSDHALFVNDVVKDTRFPLSYRAGLEVRVIDNLHLRGGLTTEPLTYSFGMGFSQNAWGFNIVAQQHFELGWNPGLDIRVNF